MAQHTIQVPLDKITYVDYYAPDTSYLGQPSVKLGGQNYYIPAIYNVSKHIFFRMNIDIPERKKLVGCDLYLYSTGDSGYQQFEITHMTTEWANPTWNTSSTGYTAGGSSVPYLDVQTNTWVSMSLMYLAPKTGYTFRLTLEDWNLPATSPNFVFNSNDAASNRPYLEITYEDVPPGIPTLLEPIGIYKDSSNIIRFGWMYNSPVGGNQKAFDLQWSADQINWNTVSQVSPDTFYDMPVNSLPSGNIYWRVQTYNQYDEASGYSAPSVFYSIGAPATPIINAIGQGGARPLISWSADSQQIYQLQILQGDIAVYDITTPSISEMQHKVTRFLDDGQYIARIRIKNEYDLWSDWGQQVFTIETIKPGAINLNVYGMKYGIKLTFDSLTNYGLIYRKAIEDKDYICVSKIMPGETAYDDYTVAHGKTYLYFMRNISTQETFADSAVISQPTNLQYTQLAPASNPAEVVVLKYNLNTPVDKRVSKDNQKTQVYFEGRAYPVSIYNGFKSHDITCAFYLDNEDADRLYTLFDDGDTVLFRDNRGRKIYGSLGNLATSETHDGQTASFSVTRVDYAEGIEV